METVVIEPHGKIALLRLDNGVTNAISPLLVDELGEAVRKVQAEFHGMVLAGGSKFFCIGLDLPTLLKLDRAKMGEFWEAFDQVVLDLFSLLLPTAAAMAGHATAGGTILALTADYRFGVSGRRLMGLNEVNIGVPVPFLADLMLRHIISERSATDLVYRGELLAHEHAKEIGLVDEIYAEDELESSALEAVDRMVQRPQPAFGIIKKNRIQAVCRRFESHRRAKKEEMMSCWFLPAVQTLLTQAAEKF
jgi:enoyl-CoA hydratase/carnithine racemase